jgi:hypothetical protein
MTTTQNPSTQLSHAINIWQLPLVKVADVRINPNDSAKWCYSNINENIMYGNNGSYIYCITSKNEEIVKIGESEQPLGIIPKSQYRLYEENNRYYIQPITGTKSRLGRYANQTGSNDTDNWIRTSLKNEVVAGYVAIWAAELPTSNITVGKFTAAATCHKTFEKLLLDEYYETFNSYPRCNKGRA